MKIKIFDKKGFTLVELLIVVAIIGVLATLLMVNFVGVRQRARDAQRKSDLRQIQSALEIYRADNSAYPLTVSGLNSGCPASFTYNGTTYMQKVPCDPLGTSYSFSSTGTTYSIIACLENANDNQKDAANVSPCNGTSNWSYTVQNP
ncbi:MAG: type II secretion system protein GspG [Patescibacteria group bacterium]|nr:type II secretion system protein GspG [Patescibacteria group bacterium]